MVSGVQRFRVDRDSSAGVAAGFPHSGAPLCVSQLVSDLGVVPMTVADAIALAEVCMTP